jgi:hypothetical protein
MRFQTLLAMCCTAGSLQLGCTKSPTSSTHRDNVGDLCIGGQRLDEAIPSTGAVPANCVRTEGGQLGQLGELKAGNATVKFESWRNKDGEGQYIGFTIATTGNVAYAVKAGGETFYGTNTTWVHPEGTGGPKASAISNITFCEVLPEGTSSDGGIPEGGGGGEIEPCGESPRLPGGGACTKNSQCASSTCIQGECLEEGGTGAGRKRSGSGLTGSKIP